MAIPPDFLRSLRAPHPAELAARYKAESTLPGGAYFAIHNQLRPVDLYCYLSARFGAPNGIQNFLRNDSSDNLIHWEWTLAYDAGLISFGGSNFRTDVLCHGIPVVAEDRDALVALIRDDLHAHGPRMGEIRRQLENWTEFVNPHVRIRRAITGLHDELKQLQLDPEGRDLAAIWKENSPDHAGELWSAAAQRYSKGVGLCFGIRAMIPVLAESFVNLTLSLLMRPDLKSDDRLRDNVFRQPIDVRVKSLHVNCVGFARAVDYTADACANFHRLVNERNDLLHGNVVVEKLKFNEVYFDRKVPIFKEYRALWRRTIGVWLGAVGLEHVDSELAIVDAFIEYVLSCLRETAAHAARQFLASYELGREARTGRLGVLFPNALVDFVGEGMPRFGSDVLE